MKKVKRIISLVLSAVLTLSVCFTGGILSASAAATVIDEGNYLANGDFESTSDVWNGTISGYGKDGFTDIQGVSGQGMVFVNGWRLNRWNGEPNPPYVSHITDCVSGNFALKFRTQPSGNNTTVYARTETLLTDKITAGYYQLSAYVKGTNAKSTLTVGVTSTETSTDAYTYTTNIPASETWQKITVDNIYLSDNAANMGTYQGDKYIGRAIQFNIKVDTVETELYIDNVRLEKMTTDKNSNLIIDGGFDTQSCTGAAVGHGHYSELTEDWAGFNWYSADEGRSTLTLSNDETNGNYLEFAVPTHNSPALFLYTRNSCIDFDSIKAGYYDFTAWVKTNNTRSYMRYITTDGTTNTETIGATFISDGQWHQVQMKNIYISDGASNLKYYEDTDDGNKNGMGYALGFYIRGDASVSDGYLMIDNVSLTKTENIFTNSGFEIASPKTAGYTDYIPPSGQNQDLANGWYDRSWDKRKSISHVTDNVHSGSYALYYKYNSNGTAAICPGVSTITNVITTTTTLEDETTTTTYTLPAGTYRLSVWAYGDTPVRVGLPSSKNSDWITAGDKWTQISYIATYENDVKLTTNASRDSKGPIMTSSMGVTIAAGTEETYAIIDDICLEKLDTIDEVKGQIMGINQPTVSAKKLELPVLDTNNPNIEVSIAASSNEGVIALDGTITTPKTQKIVDITLKISDGTNEVTLDPIGVLVHGELDTVTQTVIEKAIEDLDVKATTADADMNEINYWLEHKSGYVSTVRKNLYSQKKLVYTYDIKSDYVLDKNDIAAVRDDLLGDKAEYDIRYLVTMYSKVVEYNGYN